VVTSEISDEIQSAVPLRFLLYLYIRNIFQRSSKGSDLKKFLITTLLFSCVSLFASPEHKVCDGKRIIGESETVRIVSADMNMEARIDTGATTTSIDARKIEVTERDGKKWVSFELVDRGGSRVEKLEKPVAKIVPIKRHGMKDQKRYAVKMKIALGDMEQLILVTLTDRSRFDYPVLIGRNFLRGEYIVDVEYSHTVTVEPKKEDR